MPDLHLKIFVHILPVQPVPGFLLMRSLRVWFYLLPAAPMPVSNVKKEINKLISQTYFELDNNNMKRVRELTEKINQLYKQLPAGEKKDVYNNYMTLFKDIKKKL